MNTQQKHDRGTSCPIPQMSYGEVARYLQGGFDDAVQRALAVHVRDCNTCRTELSRMRDLRMTGRDLMASSASHAGEDSGTHLDEMTMAAYVTDGLNREESEAARRHIATCHACYSTFSAVEKELASPVPRRQAAPLDVTASMLRPVQSQIELQGVRRAAENALSSIQSLLGRRWTKPALAFALGVFAMLIVSPQPKTFVALPQMVSSDVETADHVRSSTDIGDFATEFDQVMSLPESDDGTLVFTWADPLASGAGKYRVEVYSVANSQVLESSEVTDTRWEVDASAFEPGTTYDILITYLADTGGVRPVTTHRLRRD